MQIAGLMSVAAIGALAVASAPGSDGFRTLQLHAPQKLTAGPLLGLVAGRGPTGAMKLARIDPKTMRPSGSRSIRLPFADAWAVAPGGRTLALAVHPDPVNEPNSLELVRLPSLQLRAGSLRLGGDVSALAWTSPHQVVAVTGRFWCCPAPLRVVGVDLQSRRVTQRKPVAGAVLHIARWSRGLVLLTGPTNAIGAASLVVVDARGVRSVGLPSIRAGEVPGAAGVSDWRLPGLTVDWAGSKAYVVDPDGSVAEIDLATLAVSDHRLLKSRSLLAHLDGWLEPTAAAKGDSGPIRQAQWLGNGFVLVSGSDHHDSVDGLASDPAGVELIDTRTWTAYVLAPQADSFTVTNGLLLVTGARWRNRTPTGMGIAAYGPEGRRRFARFAGHDVWINHIANGRAYVWGYGWGKERVVDLRTGRIVERRPTSDGPTLLVGLGNPLE
jgi:hypothetical protein